MELQTSMTENNSGPGETENSWEGVCGLHCRLSVGLSVPDFTVRDLLALEVDSVIDTLSGSTETVPIWVNGVRIGLAEFDVLGSRLAIRISEVG